jgi:hypothetical protein
MIDKNPIPTAKVSAALVKAQGEFKPAIKTAMNPHLRSKYAPLTDVINAVKDGLSKHGLAFSQSSFIEDGVLILTTRLIHESGETLYSQVSVPLTKPDAQGAGACLSYARRYGLSSICGISTADFDDDGESIKAEAKNTAIAAAKIVKAKKAEVSDGIL